MNLTNQQVRFRIRDVYVPDGKELSFQLYADNVLRGRVLDASDNEQSDGQYAVVEVDGVDAPVVVPVARLVLERKSGFDEMNISDSCNVTVSSGKEDAMKCLADLWCDESAAIISVELVLVLTIMCTGLVVGLSATRDAVVTELADIGAGIASLNQSFSYCGVSSGSAQFSGSLFLDGLDTGDDACSQTVNANSGGITICAIQAVHEGQTSGN